MKNSFSQNLYPEPLNFPSNSAENAQFDQTNMQNFNFEPQQSPNPSTPSSQNAENNFFANLNMEKLIKLLGGGGGESFGNNMLQNLLSNGAFKNNSMVETLSKNLFSKPPTTSQNPTTFEDM